MLENLSLEVTEMQSDMRKKKATEAISMQQMALHMTDAAKEIEMALTTISKAADKIAAVAAGTSNETVAKEAIAHIIGQLTNEQARATTQHNRHLQSELNGVRRCPFTRMTLAN